MYAQNSKYYKHTYVIVNTIYILPDTSFEFSHHIRKFVKVCRLITTKLSKPAQIYGLPDFYRKKHNVTQYSTPPHSLPHKDTSKVTPFVV